MDDTTRPPGAVAEQPDGAVPTPPAEPSGRRPIDKPVLAVALVVIAVVLVVGRWRPTQLETGADTVIDWISVNLSWAFVIGATGFVVLSLVLAFSRYGRVRLGRDDERPEFSRVSWIAMMFSAGMGIGLMFFGVNEPVTHLLTPPEAGVEPGSNAAAEMAMEYTLFHWGLHPWAIYAVVGLALAYSSYRKGRTGGFSAAFAPLLRGPRGRAGARVIDVLAIFATLFGSAVSLGLGAAQMNGGLSEVFGAEIGTGTQTTIIVVLTLCFVVSAISGIERGIKWLSNTNMVLALALLLFLFVVGPTAFILNTVPNVAGDYLSSLPSMSVRTGAFGGSDWLSGWTIFYWAWWVSWTPFVGAFLAKISRGRTIREFVIGVMLVPTLVSIVWFSVLGGTAIDLQTSGALDILAQGPEESQLFAVLQQFPLAGLVSVVVVLLVAIFFVSGADAASIVMGSLSSYGDDHPRRWLTAMWGVLMGAVAIVLLQAGGLDALQNVTIIVATPFLVVMVGLAVALMKDLRGEDLPAVVRGAPRPPASGGAAPPESGRHAAGARVSEPERVLSKS